MPLLQTRPAVQAKVGNEVELTARQQICPLGQSPAAKHWTADDAQAASPSQLAVCATPASTRP
jgi:hypothetical protein